MNTDKQDEKDEKNPVYPVHPCYFVAGHRQKAGKI
jgi:hypothetical protein